MTQRMFASAAEPGMDWANRQGFLISFGMTSPVKASTNMAYAVYLSFDAVSTAAIRALTQALPLPGNVAQTGVPPHITLAGFTDAEPTALRDVTRQFASLEAPIEIDLQSLGAFASPDRVLFLAPVVTQALLEMHGRFHALLGPAGLRASDYWLPGRWVPHCTLEQKLTPAQLGEAMTQASQTFQPIRGTLGQVHLAEFWPLTPLLTQPFATSPASAAVPADAPAPSVE